MGNPVAEGSYKCKDFLDGFPGDQSAPGCVRRFLASPLHHRSVTKFIERQGFLLSAMKVFEFFFSLFFENFIHAYNLFLSTHSPLFQFLPDPFACPLSNFMSVKKKSLPIYAWVWVGFSAGL